MSFWQVSVALCGLGVAVMVRCFRVCLSMPQFAAAWLDCAYFVLLFCVSVLYFLTISSYCPYILFNIVFILLFYSVFRFLLLFTWVFKSSVTVNI